MIDLPDYPAPASATPGLLDYGSILKPTLGGPVQRINRLGSRFSLSVTMPPLRSQTDGRRWLARLIRGKTEGVRMPWPLMGFEPGAVGTVTVNGSGQSGSTLNIEGATANYAFREGQPFSIETAGRHHIYMVTAETIASGTGTASLPIAPMIRVEHLDGDVCHFAEPMIEGFIEGDEFAWEFAIGNFTQLQFRIDEAA